MTPDRLKLVEELFLAAMTLPDSQRATLLDARCNRDRELRAEVEALLGHHHVTGGVLDAPDTPGQTLRRGLGQVDVPEEVVLPRQRRIGAYTISRLLGTGGMGVVYIAEQERPRRTVALKLIRRGLASPKLIRRFEHEAEVLGRLHHPGIAQIFEAGTVPMDVNSPFSGQPFIAMEYVDGMALTKHVAERNLDVRASLELMVRVCDAMEHAHQRGVIHRDLKPGNILVTKAGEPKVLDFGIARAMDHDQGVTTVQTDIGQLIGTLPYMSPEQVGSNVAEIDTRSDIYALGVILYEVLAGKLPHDLKSRSIPDAARVIREEEPERLSAISKVFRGDIDTIVLKAMDKEKSRRYQSASELAADIRRYLAGEPIAGRRDSSMYLLSKQLKRYKWAMIAAAVFIVGAAAFAVYASVQAQRQWRLARDESLARREADAARDLASSKNEALRRSAYVSAIGFAQAALAAKDVERVGRVLDACPPDLRGWEWGYLRSVVDTCDHQVSTPGEYMLRFAATSTGDRFVAWHPGLSMYVMEKSTGRVLKELNYGSEVLAETACVSLDGTRALFGTPKSQLWVLDLETFERTVIGRPQAALSYTMAIFPDGLRALCAEQSPGKPWTPTVVSLETGETIRVMEGANATIGAVSADGKWIAAAGGGRIWVQDSDGRQAPMTMTPHRLAIRAIAFSHDGTRVATCANDGFVHVWNWSTGATKSMRLTDNKLSALTWSPSSRYIATAGTEGVISILDAETLLTITSLYGHASTVDTLAWYGAPDVLMSIARDRTIRWWNLPARPTQPVINAGSGIFSGAWFADSSAYVIGLRDGRIVKHRAKDLRYEGELARLPGTINEVAISRDGSLLAAVSEGGMALTMSLPQGEELLRMQVNAGRAIDVQFDPTGSVVYVGVDPGSLGVWDPLRGVKLREFEKGPSNAIRCAITPDGTKVVVGYQEGQLVVHDAATGKIERTIANGGSWPSQLRATPDGKGVVVVFANGLVGSWDIATGECLRTFTGHQNGVYSLSINPDGSRIATGGWDNTVRVWDYHTGLELLTFRPHIGELWVSDFSPDGSCFVSGSSDAALRMWRPVVRESRSVLGN